MPPAEFLLLSPLPNWRGTPQRITAEIAIRRLLPQERQEAADAWALCYEFENPHPADNVRYRRRQEAAFKLFLHAMYAVQILAPVGASGVLTLFRKENGALALDTMQRRQPLLATLWGGAAEVPPSFAEEIPAVLTRLHEAFQKPVLRLQIPVWLLEQGMGAPDRHIRILLWATGLDGVTGSGGVAAFGERLSELLGAETPVFPPDAAGRMPNCRVMDVVKDLYQLRTEMAHGLPFHEKFRKKREFFAGEWASFRYDQVLEECAIFLLCRTLRETFLAGGTPLEEQAPVNPARGSQS